MQQADKGDVAIVTNKSSYIQVAETQLSNTVLHTSGQTPYRTILEGTVQHLKDTTFGNKGEDLCIHPLGT